MLFYIVLRDTPALMPRGLYFPFDMNKVCLMSFGTVGNSVSMNGCHAHTHAHTRANTHTYTSASI